MTGAHLRASSGLELVPYYCLFKRFPLIFSEEECPHESLDSRASYLIFSTYDPSRVSIFNRSPLLTCRGTETTSPVDTVAGFPLPLTVSPLIPGSV